MNDLPKAKVIGANGNVFNILGICRKVLMQSSAPREKVDEMTQRVQDAESYSNALSIMQEYVEFV